MRNRINRLGVLAAVALVASVVPVTQARAQTTYEVQVAAFPSERAPAESMAFFPETIQVHQGDVLRFTTESFHTATLLPAGQEPGAWADQHASSPEQPWALVVPDPDDGAASLKANNAVVFPTDSSCGAPDNPCAFDATDDPDPVTGVLNSGLPFGPQGVDFSVEVTAPPGTVFHALCLVHTNMTMRIEVVPAGLPASDPAQIEQDTMAQLEADADEAEGVDARLSQPRKKRLPNGTRRWRAFAGFDTENISLYAMYPRRLNIRKGDRVRWSAAKNLFFEDHTITGPRSKALPIANNSFVPVCDPDGDDGPGPDNPPDTQDPPFCNDPSQLEFDIPSRFVVPHGDGRVTKGGDLESSGVFGAFFGPPDTHTLRFTKRLENPYVYICLIHPFMRGRVAVN